MSWVTGPTTITTTATQISAPSQSLGAIAGATFANVGMIPINVIVGPSQLAVMGQQSVTTPIGGGTTQITAQVLGTSGQSQLVVTWFSTNDPPVGGLSYSTANSGAASGEPDDLSGTITSPGSSVQLAPADASRQYLFIQNVASANLWVNFGNPATLGPPSVLLTPNFGYESASGFVITSAVYGWATTANSAFILKVA